MAIWNEIKRAINSNLNKPLNELIGESSDNTTVMDKLDTLLSNNGNSSGGGVQYMKSPLEYIFDHMCSTLPYNFRYGSAVVYNNEIHILGSSSSYYTSHYKWNGSSWSSVSTLPYNFCQGSAVVYNNEIHILGGNSSSYQTYHYKWNGSSWSSVSTLPYQFRQGSTVVYNNEIHILGSNADSIYNTYYYKWDSSNWVKPIPPSSYILLPTSCKIHTHIRTDRCLSANNLVDVVPTYDTGFTTFTITDPGLYYVATEHPYIIEF